MTDSAGRADIGGSAALLTLARVSSAAALFGVTVVAARLLPPEAIGSAAVGQVIGTVAALVANGGLNISTIYFLRRRPEDRGSLVAQLVPLAIASAVVAVALALTSAPVTFGPVLPAADWVLLVSAGLLGAAMIGYEFLGAVLLGLGESRRFVVLEVVRGWGSLLGVVVLLLVTREDHALVLGIAFGFASAAVVGVRRAGTRVSLRPRFSGSKARAALAFGVRGQAGNVLQFLGVRLDLLIVPALLNLQQAGLYFIAVRVSDLVAQAATAAASFLFPQVAGQDDRRNTALTERVTRATLLVTVAGAVTVALVAEPLLGVVFGAAYEAGTPALLVMLAAVVPLSVGRLIAADLKGRGRPGTVSMAASVSVLATVVLDLALIPAWGIVGAAVASFVAYSLTTAVLLIAYHATTGGMVAALVPRAADLRDLTSYAGRRLARRPSTDS